MLVQEGDWCIPVLRVCGVFSGFQAVFGYEYKSIAKIDL